MLPHPDGSVVRLFARVRDQRDGDFVRSPSEIARFAETYADRNVYVAPNPTNYLGGSRHAARDVTHWSYFLLDMDPVCFCTEEQKGKRKAQRCGTCRGKADPAAALGEALACFGKWVGLDFVNIPDQRPIVIDSGRGCQAWIRLGDVLLRDDPGIAPLGRIVDLSGWLDEVVSRSTVRRTHSHWLKRLDAALGVRYGCRLDTSVSDLPRVMRCPGTINVKTGRMAKFIVATHRKFPGLARTLVEGTPVSVFIEPEVGEVAPGQPWQMVFSHLTRSAQDYLLYGQEEPGRHKVMWHTARKFQEVGVTRPEARRALIWANALKGEEEELPTDQVEHALNTAYGEK